ncbi:hypothetical protein [uncultured Cetobacterium sp.]|uniref:hypothetical protein n=2 Tax=uncultured Cetobacterium sp. TaxID=527638 RepID=UPI00260BF661|nr:hypothetical protein [uncultured Cetobacterium sp.]
MKKILCGFLLLTSMASAAVSVNRREADDLKDRLKLYTQGYYKRAFRMRNHLAKREIVIDRKMRDLPQNSKIAFGKDKYYSSRDWELNRNKKGIQYFSVPGTTRRKAVQRIDGKYVVFFYNAVGRNDDMVEDTFKDVRKSLERN